MAFSDHLVIDLEIGFRVNLYRKQRVASSQETDQESFNTSQETNSPTIADNLKIHGYSPESNIVPVEISSWNVNTALKNNSNYKLGDFYFYRCIYTFSGDGTITKIQANGNYKSKNVMDSY